KTKAGIFKLAPYRFWLNARLRVIPEIFNANTSAQIRRRIFSFVMNYYDELTKSCPPPIGTMVGNKTDGYTKRLVEANRLTKLMQAQRPCCFLRMGNGELKHLLIYQSNQLDQFDPSQ